VNPFVQKWNETESADPLDQGSTRQRGDVGHGAERSGTCAMCEEGECHRDGLTGVKHARGGLYSLLQRYLEMLGGNLHGACIRRVNPRGWTAGGKIL